MLSEENDKQYDTVHGKWKRTKQYILVFGTYILGQWLVTSGKEKTGMEWGALFNWIYEIFFLYTNKKCSEANI